MLWAERVRSVWSRWGVARVLELQVRLLWDTRSTPVSCSCNMYRWVGWGQPGCWSYRSGCSGTPGPHPSPAPATCTDGWGVARVLELQVRLLWDTRSTPVSCYCNMYRWVGRGQGAGVTGQAALGHQVHTGFSFSLICGSGFGSSFQKQCRSIRIRILKLVC